ncbi:putative triacylglycerol lipase [Helianthus annuus]|nr:putative triacylglycerol lipase [Helianthus annuus]
MIMNGATTLCSVVSRPEFTGQVILYGVNYASGGGGIMNATEQIFVNKLSIDIQIDYFNITRKQIDKLLGASKAREHVMKKSIFSITIGSNDFLNNYFASCSLDWS